MFTVNKECQFYLEPNIHYLVRGFMFIVNEAQKMKNVSMLVVNETHQFYVHSK